MKDEGEAQLDSVEEELRDFLAADTLDVQVVPVFKERLRRELWEIVERNAAKWRAARGEVDSDSGSDE